MKESESARKYFYPLILMYIGLSITIATVVLLGHATPVTIEDIFVGFMVGQIFFNFGIVLEVSRLRR